MHNFTFAVEEGLKVLIAGLLLGAGLPALFALSVRAMSHAGTVTTIGALPRTALRATAALSLALVIGFVSLGITYIVISGSGKTFAFDGIVPSIVDK